jgi:hypothetical protein
MNEFFVRELKKNRIDADALTENQEFPKWIEKLFPDGLLMFPCAGHVYVRSNGNLISEPYNVTMTDIQNLIFLCEGNNLKFDITGNALHHPLCIRIEITPNEGL